jgi:BolA family transcriptional regulator, general stress-responsive regulator
MDMPTKIQTILKLKLNAEFVEIEDESHLHANHKGRVSAPAGSGHYNVAIASEQFVGKTLMQQHRLVYSALAEEMHTTIHALAIATYTPEQWANR